MLAIPMIPLQILLPWIISKYTSGPKPMNVYLYAFPCRLLIGLVLAGLVYVTPNFKLEDSSFPVYYYGLVLFIYALHQVRFIWFIILQAIYLNNLFFRMIRMLNDNQIEFICLTQCSILVKWSRGTKLDAFYARNQHTPFC